MVRQEGDSVTDFANIFETLKEITTRMHLKRSLDTVDKPNIRFFLNMVGSEICEIHIFSLQMKDLCT